jgi:probable F420-dependent oxidoreductase
MKIGAAFPQIELAGQPDSVRRLGLAMEEMGFDHFLMYDHVVGAVHENRNPPLGGYYNENDPFYDPFTVLSYLAAITKRMHLATGILILPQRQTVLVAKQAADIDILSGGRLRLCVGTGWNYVEYEALGEDFSKRGAKMSEQIPYLRRLWTESVVSFEGQFHRLDRAALVPRPSRPIPIWCGGFTPPAYKRAAQMADGFLFSGAPEGARKGIQRLREVLKEHDRTEAGFGFEYLLQQKTGNGLSIAEAVDAAKRWQDIGGTHVSVVTNGLGLTSIDQHIAHLAEIRWRLADM